MKKQKQLTAEGKLNELLSNPLIIPNLAYVIKQRADEVKTDACKQLAQDVLLTVANCAYGEGTQYILNNLQQLFKDKQINVQNN